MLTVIMIISILMGVSSVAISGAYKSARRTRSRDLCRQLVVSWNTYLMDERKFPAESVFDTTDSEEGFLAATAANIGKGLNTTYNSKGEPYSDSKIYFETSVEECERSGKFPNYTYSGTGIRDDWKNLIYFTLDFDYDGKIQSVVDGKDVTCNAYSYAKCDRKDPKKYMAAW